MECTAAPAFAASAQALASVEGVVAKDVRIGTALLTSRARPCARRSCHCRSGQGRLHSASGSIGPSMAASATESLTLPILGMTCASCQHHVEEALRSTAGVESARVDLMANRARVVFDPAIAHAGRAGRGHSRSGLRRGASPRRCIFSGILLRRACSRSRPQGSCHAHCRRGWPCCWPCRWERKWARWTMF